MFSKKILGEKYFKHRLGDIYKYARIPYQSGKGKCNKDIEYFWEMCIDISGNIIFVLHCQKEYNYPMISESKKIESFSGISCDNKWIIECKNLHFLSAQIKVNKNSCIFYIPESIDLKKNKQNEIPQVAKAYFSNFAFSGIDYKSGFIVNNNNKELHFNMIDNSKEILDLIDIKRIDNAILSNVTIPIHHHESIQSVNNEIESISYFVSLLNLNTNSVPIIEYLSDDDILQYSIKNTVKTPLSKKYIIDNFRIEQGIPKAFNNCYANYKSWHNQINLNIVIDYLAEINRQQYIDLKLSTMIMAYEYFLTKYLINQNLLQTTDMDKSIQDKLRNLNNHLQFIPSNMMKDTLRESIRNPLFHQGEIPLMEKQHKIDIFKKYYDLLIKIILRVIG